jgi:hypothetical protein
MQAITYNAYSILITEIKAEPKRWQACIRRLDGAKIKITANDSIRLVAMMPEEFSADKAVEQAKKSIDAGAFSKVPEE